MQFISWNTETKQVQQHDINHLKQSEKVTNKIFLSKNTNKLAQANMQINDIQWSESGNYLIFFYKNAFDIYGGNKLQ